MLNEEMRADRCPARTSSSACDDEANGRVSPESIRARAVAATPLLLHRRRGSGDATLIEAEGAVISIDGGPGRGRRAIGAKLPFSVTSVGATGESGRGRVTVDMVEIELLHETSVAGF